MHCARGRALAFPLALFAIFATAVFLRFYGLGVLPPGLFHDEAAIGLDALDVLRTGNLPIYFERTTGGQEPIFGYLTILSMLLLGQDVLAMRVVAPIVGLLTVAVTYALGKEMHGRWVGLIASMLVAVSYWQVHESHTSFRAVTLPLMVGLTFFLIWRALRKGSIVSYTLAGLAGGLTMYTYQSSRMFPLLVALAFAYLCICQRERICWKGLAVFGAAMLAISVPLGIYYVGHPELFIARIDQVGAAGTTWDGFGNALGMFSNRGDITWKFNLPGKPVFDPFVSALFYLGVVVSLWRWRQPSYGILLLWVVIMLLPTALSTESPHFLRALGIVPAVYVLPAVGATWLVGTLSQWAPVLSKEGFQHVGYLAFAGWLALGATATYIDYFGEWASNPGPFEDYNGDVEAAARYLNTLSGNEVVMFSSQYYGHYTVSFFERRRLDLRWFDGRQSLPFPDVGDRDTVYVFPKSASPSQAYLDAMLGPGNLAGQARGPQGQISFQAYRLSPEKLAQARAALVPPEPLSIRAGDELELLGYQLGEPGANGRPEARPGAKLPLNLYWRVLKRTGADYSFFSHLLDYRSKMWGQGDTNQYWSSDWHPGDLVVGRYDIAVQPTAPAGKFTVEVGIFDRKTGGRLSMSNGSDILPLGAVKVSQLTQPPIIGAGLPLELSFGDSIGLLDYKLEGAVGLPASAKAGDSLTFVLYWKSLSRVSVNYTAFIHLVDPSGRLVAQADSEPQAGAFPTSYWEPGEVVADRLQLALGDVRPGLHTVHIGLYQLATGQRLAVSAGVTALGDNLRLGQLEVAP